MPYQFYIMQGKEKGKNDEKVFKTNCCMGLDIDNAVRIDACICVRFRTG